MPDISFLPFPLCSGAVLRPFYLFRDGKTEMSCVLQTAHALAGDVEKDDRRAQDAARADNVQVEDVGHGQ